MNSKNNNLPLTHADGTVNTENPLVLASILDGVGTLLTCVFNDLVARPDILNLMNDATKKDLESVLHTLRLLRNATGRDCDWYSENMAYHVPAIYKDSAAKRESYANGIIKAMLDAGVPLDLIPPELRPKPSAADAADALLESLRADGVIG